MVADHDIALDIYVRANCTSLPDLSMAPNQHEVPQARACADRYFGENHAILTLPDLRGHITPPNRMPISMVTSGRKLTLSCESELYSMNWSSMVEEIRNRPRCRCSVFEPDDR